MVFNGNIKEVWFRGTMWNLSAIQACAYLLFNPVMVESSADHERRIPRCSSSPGR